MCARSNICITNSGVLEVVRIRREAYPVRVPFSEFYERFEMLYARSARKAARSSNGTATANGESSTTALLPAAAAASTEQAKAACKLILASHIGTDNPYFQV